MNILNIKDMKTIYFYLVSIIMILCFSCTEKEMGPISGSSGKPGQVEILDTTVIPGGVIVNYKIPPVNDIIEIKAIYTLSSGQKRESSSSFYTSFMTIDGYNDTLEHEALIYTINRAREMSDAVSVKFRPGESALSKAAKSMQIISDFGGVNFSWRNPDKATLIFELYTENEQGEMVTLNIISSKTDSTNLSFRGYDTVPRKFAVNIRDNFGNSSGIIYPEGEYITPLFEMKLDKTIQKIRNLPGDTNWNNWEGRDMNFIDDDIMTIIHSPVNAIPGATITLDIGKKAKLSRFLLHQRMSSNILYNNSNPHIFEVYSSDDLGDNPSGNWNDWTYRTTCTMIKPSGAARGTVTEDDRVEAEKGHDFSLPLDMPPVRYMRIRFLECWEAANTMTCPSEITVYGFYDE
jgi:hypothetical protein